MTQQASLWQQPADRTRRKSQRDKMLYSLEWYAKFTVFGWAKVDRGGDDECWPWTAALDQGYGAFWQSEDKSHVQAHRFAYEQEVGPIPDGLTLDHLCRNPPCVNHRHLEPVTVLENTMRGEGIAARNAQKTHCVWGHPFSEKNTAYYKQSGRRVRHYNS